MDSPPRFPEMNSPRFTEHLHSSPPYQQYPTSPELAYPTSPELASRSIPQYGADDNVRHMGPRLSTKERPLSPELMSPGLESVWAGEGEKEVFYPTPQPHPYQPPQEQEQPGKRRLCGMPAKLFYALLAAVLGLAIGLGVGLGVGLGMKKSSSNTAPPPSTSPSSTSAAPTATPTVDPEYLIGGALSPAYYSTAGAFNGSGIALASQSFVNNLNTGAHGNLVMYFQHHSGQIRYQQLTPDDGWQGGSASEVVATDARNSTPLSAVAYVTPENMRLVDIDVNNQIKQRSGTNLSSLWTDGPINDANLTVHDADQVGMQACWYGSDYGDSDYTHTPLPTSGPDAAFTSDVGMHIWYGSNATTFQQYGWRAGDDSWTYQATWQDYNAHAGVGCYSWGPGTVTYVMMVNLQDTVEFWWKDTDTNLTGTTSHPINQWTNASKIAVNNVNPATSLGYTNYFYAQMADTNMINGFNISWAAENTTIMTADGDTFTVDGEPGIPGTHLSVSALPQQSGGDIIVAFYQTTGSDITEYTRDLVAGQWTSSAIAIPPT
ncbi:hypothetical protein LTR85_005033 [Meristemomyces frigidus]|nr:hypothetical protein LTR85_005033 [Meristemomyces frigidus]